MGKRRHRRSTEVADEAPQAKLSVVAAAAEEGLLKTQEEGIRSGEEPQQFYRLRSGRGRPPKRHAPDSSKEEAGPAEPPEQLQEAAPAESVEQQQQEVAPAEPVEQRQEEAAPAEPVEEQLQQAEEEDMEAAVPIGNPVIVTGRGRKKMKHYKSFQFDGLTFELEDSVMFSPEEASQKPYVAILKDIKETEGSLSLTCQWFYRPDEADIGGGKFYVARDTRELYYSFHIDDVPAESVLHKCAVHFIPQNKQIPLRKKHPGFIVQKVYGAVEKKLWDLTDKEHEDRQHDIDILLKKTLDRIGELPDIEPEDTPGDRTDQLSDTLSLNNTDATRNPGDSTSQFSDKLSLHNKDVNRTDVTRKPPVGKPEKFFTRAEIPESARPRNYAILARYKALTGKEHRDKWLDKLLESIPLTWSKAARVPHADPGTAAKSSSNCSSANIGSDDNKKLYILDDVVPMIVSIERSAHEALGADFRKYNQKLRQLSINIKNSSKLCRRLMGKELDPPALLTMSPDELKDGLTAAEKTTEPEQSRQLQMTDARCQRCQEKKVGISDIMRAGNIDRYQLECISCGNTWFSCYDDIVSLTVDSPSTAAAGSVAPGTNPWAKVHEKQQRSDHPACTAAGPS
ncbi:hypothetical protein EJB05_26013, partial [Eragrostis curvula]